MGGGAPSSGPSGFRRWGPSPLRTLSGGCLSLYWQAWRDTGAEPWVVEVLWLGYCLPFLSTPRLPLFPSQCLLPAPPPSRGLPGGGHLGLNCHGCCGACSTHFSSLLQPSVHSVEDLEVMASGHRPLPSHSLCGRVSLPDGDHSVCAPGGASGGLDGLPRSDGSVPQVPVPQLLVTFFASGSVTLSITSERCALASPRLRRSSPGSWLLFRLYSILWGSV